MADMEVDDDDLVNLVQGLNITSRRRGPKPETQRIFRNELRGPRKVLSGRRTPAMHAARPGRRNVSPRKGLRLVLDSICGYGSARDTRTVSRLDDKTALQTTQLLAGIRSVGCFYNTHKFSWRCSGTGAFNRLISEMLREFLQLPPSNDPFDDLESIEMEDWIQAEE